MKNVKIIGMLVLNTIGWSLGFSFLLAVVNIIIPKFGAALPLLLGAFFMERETRKRKKQYIYPLVSSLFLSVMAAVFTYELTSRICTLIVTWSIPQKYCVNELYGDLAIIEGVLLMVPWLFILFMYLWYRVILRKKYFPE